MRQAFTGCGTALVTPFTRSGALDEAGVRRLAHRQIEAGIHFLVPCGTTGETPTLTSDERLRVVEIVVEAAKGKAPVLAGAGGYNTHEVIESAQQMARAGADGILSVAPYYNKPTPEGLYQHYKAIAEAVPVPVIVFLTIAVVAHVVLSYTRFGRGVYAVGGNPEAARLSGLKVDRLTLAVYVIIGCLAGLGGFILSARLNSSEAVAGQGYELTVIASVVIGGTSLFGGIGTIFGTVVGTVLIGVLLNGLVLNNVSSYVQQIVIGVIIVLAVAFDTFAKSRRRRA